MRRIILMGLVALWNMSCSKGGGSTPVPEPPAPVNPGKPELLLPTKDAVCVNGTAPASPTNDISFDWKDATNTGSYELSIKNLLTGITTKHKTTASDLKLSLEKEVPYSWSVTAVAGVSSTTTQSDSWKFYSAGAAKSHYAPFPATANYPAMDQQVTVAAGKITFRWEGSDADGDIDSYEILIGKTINVTQVGTTQAATTTFEAAVDGKSDYYWKVVTRDKAGNSSQSAMFRFKTN